MTLKIEALSFSETLVILIDVASYRCLTTLILKAGAAGFSETLVTSYLIKVTPCMCIYTAEFYEFATPITSQSDRVGGRQAGQ